MQTSTLKLVPLGIAITACASSGTQPNQPTPQARTYSEAELDELRRGTRNGAWASTYSALPSTPTVIRNATIMTAAGDIIEDGDIYFANGSIEAVGTNLSVPSGTEEIDGTGRYVTPGLIDTHSHLGVSATPEVSAHFDNNDAGNTTPQLWIEHSVWPQGPGYSRALAGGVTTAQLLPGSGDHIEGRSVTVKFVPGRTVQDMIFPGAPHGLKFACGENPKNGGGFPNTRMGNVSIYRNTFIRAERYRDQWDAWLDDPAGDPPSRDLGMETMAEVLRGNILPQVHCYRSDDITGFLQVAQEFDITVRSFHHATEAYKVRDYLAEHGAAASMWSDWWGFKMEAFDGIMENAALVSEAGATAIIHSDSDLGIQLLNQDAAKAMHAGRRAGIDITENEALRWITANAAWALGIEDEVGTLEAGKNADVVIWSGHPFSVYSHADVVWIDGAVIYDRDDSTRQPVSDFEVGILGGNND